MAADCSACSIVSGRKIYFQKCPDCGTVFCPQCSGQNQEPFVCAKCKSSNVQVFRGDHGDLLDLM